jgi:hypothetical protein
VSWVERVVWAKLGSLFQLGHRYDAVVAPPAISVAIDEIAKAV